MGYLIKQITFRKPLCLGFSGGAGGVRWGHSGFADVMDFFLFVFGCDFFSILEILNGFWETKMTPRSICERFVGSFFGTRFSSYQFLVVFGRLRAMKIELPHRRDHDFCKMGVLKKK